ncbi:MAG TPA: hypothetical protein VG602_02060 [Actinomycetota bacterium]|nr:hypothetical protein [Actinomycetota bacterium]
MRPIYRLLFALTLALPLAAGPATGAGAGSELTLNEFKPDPEAMCEVRDELFEQILATHEPGTWAPLKFEPTDEQLAKLGLPSSEVLNSRDYSQPTIVSPDGEFAEIPMADLRAATQQSFLPAVASYGGTGCLGIRPGAFLLLLDGGVGWCSMAHVYGSPGRYSISTAGHCGGSGDTATVIAAFGNNGSIAGPVLLDFGTFKSSTDGGLGKDKALISIISAAQPLVTPTMCVWGGPRGVYTKTGGTVTVEVFPRPGVTVNTDPFLPQAIVHYGHGIGIGAGGTPRAGSAIHWGNSHFMFFGAINLGDSGSGANTVTGDSIGANMEAAGIITHIWVDPLMRQGLGIMGGTRVTAVGTPTNGQLVGYPAPVPILP